MKKYIVNNSYDTKKIQEIIDNIDTEGGILYFSKGKYELSTIFLKDNIHVYIEKGAILLGTKKFEEYANVMTLGFRAYQDMSHCDFRCAMFVGDNCKNISIKGQGVIDMRSVWDVNDLKNKTQIDFDPKVEPGIDYRGAKCIVLRCCKNVEVSGIKILNATDLAVYFCWCENVDIHDLKLRVYIDGISPDNCKNVKIYNCNVEAGDDGIVLKSSFNMNKFGTCENIQISNCLIKSRCNAIKFGTESNGGFKNITINNIKIKETRITGISIESVDGAVIDNVNISNIKMRNVNAPLFIHLGKRLRGPDGIKVGSISNITIDNIKATGPYKPYKIIEWNYDSFLKKDKKQNPKLFGKAEGFLFDTEEDVWQFTSNICGLPNNNLKNISLSNVYFSLDGGVDEYNRDVPEEAYIYPEVFVYGSILPAKGIYFRHIDGLNLKNIVIKTKRKDKRENIVLDDINDYFLS